MLPKHAFHALTIALSLCLCFAMSGCATSNKKTSNPIFTTRYRNSPEKPFNANEWEDQHTLAMMQGKYANIFFEEKFEADSYFRAMMKAASEKIDDAIQSCEAKIGFELSSRPNYFIIEQKVNSGIDFSYRGEALTFPILMHSAFFEENGKLLGKKAFINFETVLHISMHEVVEGNLVLKDAVRVENDKGDQTRWFREGLAELCGRMSDEIDEDENYINMFLSEPENVLTWEHDDQLYRYPHAYGAILFLIKKLGADEFRSLVNKIATYDHLMDGNELTGITNIRQLIKSHTGKLVPGLEL